MEKRWTTSTSSRFVSLFSDDFLSICAILSSTVFVGAVAIYTKSIFKHIEDELTLNWFDTYRTTMFYYVLNLLNASSK